LLGERRGAIVSVLGIILYTLLVGANPAVVRAAILGLLHIFGHQVSCRQVGLNSLVIMAELKSHPIIRTDQNGWIEISTDENQMWVEVVKR